MVKKRILLTLSLSFVLVFLVFSSIISASHNLGENETYGFSKKEYKLGEEIKGWVNISFENEPVNNIFRNNSENKGKEISIYELLNGSLNKDYGNYSCNFENCEPNYVTKGDASSEKSVLIKKDKSKIFGLKFNGDIYSIDSASFNLTSDAGEKCHNQIEVDLFDDGKVDLINKNVISDTCGDNSYGCFDKEHSTNKFVFDSNSFKYCQKINITRSPGVVVGANMRNKTGSTNLTMRIYDMGGMKEGSCNLPNPSDEWKEINCSIDHAFVGEEEPYFVCLGVIGEEPQGEYLLKGYNPSSNEKKCGDTTSDPDSFDPQKAFQIFVKSKKFGSVDEIKFGELGKKIENYLKDTYGNMDCSSHECIVPIKVTSNIPGQTVNITDVKIEIIYNDEISMYVNSLYNVTKDSAKINSSYDKLYFNDAGFLSPKGKGDFNFSLYYKGGELFNETLRVVEVPHNIFLINPRSLETSTVIVTNFEVSAKSEKNISNYSWYFEDTNSTEITTSNNISHVYESTGNYTVIVNVTDQAGRTGSNKFNISVSTPKQTIENLLESKKNNLDSFNSDLSSLSSFKKSYIESSLGVSDDIKVLNQIDKNYTKDNPDEEMNKFAKKLIELKIPSSAKKILSPTGMPSYPSSENAKPSVIDAITQGGNYSWDKQDEYSTAIEKWNTGNLNIEISQQEYVVEFGRNTNFFHFFTLSIKPKSDSVGRYYFVIDSLENLEFEGINVSKTSEGDYYTALNGDNEISFATTQDIGFDEIPYFISPKLSKLNLNGKIPVKKEEKLKWYWYIAIVVGLAIIGLVIYYFLQRWYDKKYEHSLFKDKNKLYNLANYVTQAKNNGMSNSEIRKNLKKANWSGEQIRYVMKKYAGKRAGLPKLFGTDKSQKPKKPRSGGGKPRRQGS